MKSITITTGMAIAAFAASCLTAEGMKNMETEMYNVIWDSPSENSHGSMPIGNGDIGANVWVEPSGDLVLLLSKTDAWDELSRLCKLGRIRIKLPSVEGFRQELRLADGEILIHAGGVRARVWIDANRPVMHVELDGEKPFETTVTHETWRQEERVLKGGETRGAWSATHSSGGLFTPIEPRVYPDTVLDDGGDRIVFFHRNPTSVWAHTMRMQKLGELADPADDPLLHRTFGGVVTGSNLVSDGKHRLVSRAPATKHAIAITALTAQTPTADGWVDRVTQLHADAAAVTIDDARAAHAAWWKAFWERSWIHASGDADAERVSRAYALQRWVNACAGRGGAPIKFNGSIFNVECVRPIKTYNGVVNYDADFREWGDPYWFQNTRLIYWTMPMAGDFDLMQPMLNMYVDALPYRKQATRTYFKHDGAFYPEIMTFWGTSFLARDTDQWDPENPQAEQLWWGGPRAERGPKHNPGARVSP